jgi:AraC-like DNA-binding protein
MRQPPELKIAQLGFQLIPPSRLLSPYVRSYWHFLRDTPLLTHQDEYMHPMGRFGIGFNFGDPLRLDAQAIADPIFLDGVNTISRRMSFLGRVELMGVSFHEGAAFPFLAIPLIELQNAVSLLDALGSPDLLRLHAQMQEAKTLPIRIRLLEEWLLSRLLLGKERDRLIPASLNELRKSMGHMPISELAQEFSISQRQLERLYQNQVGVSPKQFSQLLRVETARLALRQINKSSTANLAVELGFYDQSHFIREFSAVIGLTPYAYYMKRKRSGD